MKGDNSPNYLKFHTFYRWYQIGEVAVLSWVLFLIMQSRPSFHGNFIARFLYSHVWIFLSFRFFRYIVFAQKVFCHFYHFLSLPLLLSSWWFCEWLLWSQIIMLVILYRNDFSESHRRRYSRKMWNTNQENHFWTAYGGVFNFVTLLCGVVLFFISGWLELPCGQDSQFIKT